MFSINRHGLEPHATEQRTYRLGKIPIDVLSLAPHRVSTSVVNCSPSFPSQTTNGCRPPDDACEVDGSGAVPYPSVTMLGSELSIPINLSWMVIFFARVERCLLLAGPGQLLDEVRALR